MIAGMLGHSTFDMALRVYTHPITEAPQRHAAIEDISSRFLALDTTQVRFGISRPEISVI